MNIPAYISNNPAYLDKILWCNIEIENPFRSTTPTVDLGAAANLNTIGGQLTGGDLLAGVRVPNTGELPFDQLKTNQQKIAKGQGIFKDDITFGG